MTIRTLPHTNYTNMTKRQQKSSSPTNVNAFPSEGWMTRTRPIACTVSGRTGDIIGFNDYYFEAERVLCTRAFSISAVGTTVNDGESPPGSTELDDETGHNCKMPHNLYRIFCTSVLGLHPDSWAITRSEAAFKNLILHDLDAMMYYFDTDTYYKNEPISLPGDLKDMATIFARLTLLLVGADACTPHIIKSVWGEDDDARLTLGGPRSDLSLIRRRLLTLSKVAINTVHIWLTDSTTPILAPTSDSYDRLPSTLRQLLLHSSDKLVFAREPVPRGTESVELLMKNLQKHRVPNTLTLEENAIIWYRSLLLNQAHSDDMTGFDTGILIAYGMCPPVELAQYYQMDPATQPTHFMRGTHTEVWGDDVFEVMHTTAADWDSDDNDDSP